MTAAALRVGGLLPLTTLDYPEHLACVVFCQGCAWRCRYCHNPDLITPRGSNELEWRGVLEFLQQRQGLLQAVVFSGGEASLQAELPQAIEEVRAMGFLVGLHTAGIKPKALQQVLPLVDWVGYDIKGLPQSVPLITGVPGSGSHNWYGLELLLASGVAYEVRVSWHPALLSGDELLRIASRLRNLGVTRLAIQIVRCERMLDPALSTLPVSYQERLRVKTTLTGQWPQLIWRD
ncbi:anaerobic ribonucleoside-triphosphate reductase activating protein [Atopomonas sediminilitoris]|uniref:anaerobic ribonucleoside-triphosphate reductase activating protein n=1 Tax=Atopomonas sediminilitoris TaxID=2919919 RepID=UPI001F4DC993|nr:anaerobic ribonucleoside-triphosphate reductase activating protein [Atopomonas sediminilitoris]MCJ8169157.1 anaerobic ribonucleoside-triphosphate reductase activating protein [Atopomonas sediminilitoris]